MTKARDIASAIPAPSTVSSAELGYLDGVTSAIQTQVDAKTAKATLTTTGDIYYASAANTPARLGIGSTSQVLTVASGVPSWATPSGAGFTRVANGSLSGASVTISSLDANDIIIVVTGATATNATARITWNGDTGSNYIGQANETATANILSAGAGASGANFFCHISLAKGVAILKPVYTNIYGLAYKSNVAITSANIATTTGTWTAGSYEIWTR